jgi:hypothetical protein
VRALAKSRRTTICDGGEPSWLLRAINDMRTLMFSCALTLAHSAAPAAHDVPWCPPEHVTKRTNGAPGLSRLWPHVSQDPYHCLSAFLLHLVKHFAHHFSASSGIGGGNEGRRGYNEDKQAVASEVAACKQHLRASGVHEGTIAESCIDNAGGDSLLANREFYEAHMLRLAAARGNVSMLAIGVFRGESLAVWSDWLHTGHIVGLDVNLGPANAYRSVLEAKGGFGAKNVQLIETDTTDAPRFVATRAAHPTRFQPKSYDVIIDDGCHTNPCIVDTYAAVIDLLKSGGYYFVEDNMEACKTLQTKQVWAEASFKGVRIPDAHSTAGSKHPTYLCALRAPFAPAASNGGKGVGVHGG